METVATRLQETGQHFADAGRHLLGTIETEAKRWRRYATVRGAQLRTEAKTALSIASAEKALLTQVDRTLRAIDARIRARLAQLERKPASGKSRKGTSNGKGASSSKSGRKSKQALPPLAA